MTSACSSNHAAGVAGEAEFCRTLHLHWEAAEFECGTQTNGPVCRIEPSKNPERGTTMTTPATEVMFCRTCRHRADQHNDAGQCILIELPQIAFRLDCPTCTGLDPVPACELFPTARFDDTQCFIGHEPRACGEHRTTGLRAWCFDCGEWCYPGNGCIRCRHPEG